MTEQDYGDQRACKFCGFDIEFHGKPRRETLVRNVTIVRGGWIDRGSCRFCPHSRRLHQPYLENQS